MKYKRSDFSYDGRRITFADGMYKELKKDFFDVDVDNEIQKMERWLLANPPKKNWARFIVNWLNRAPKKFGVKPQDEPRYQPRSKVSQPSEFHAVDFLGGFNQLRKN